MRFALVCLIPMALVAGCSKPSAGDAVVETAPDLEPSSQTMAVSTDLAKGDTRVTRVKLNTTKGDIVIDVHHDWAPIGAEHFLKLVKEGFYEDVKFFRVVPNFMVQVGMNGDPEVHAKWRDQTIQDEPTKKSNEPGMVTFAKTGAPNSRSTQFFINTGSNGFLDNQGFAPFGEVVEGMDVVKSINDEYGERPDQMMIIRKGNEYLNEKFPNLDGIKSIEIVGETEA